MTTPTDKTCGTCRYGAFPKDGDGKIKDVEGNCLFCLHNTLADLKGKLPKCVEPMFRQRRIASGETNCPAWSE